MTETHDEFRRYLEQRIAMGEDRIFLSTPGVSAQFAMHGPQSGEPQPAAPAEPAQINPPGEAGTGRTKREPALPASDWRKDAPPIPGPGIVIPAADSTLFENDPLAELDLDALGDIIRQCKKCQLCTTRTNAVPGEGNPAARLMVVGEGPGATEDETGRPFVGRAGKLLDDILKAIGFERESVFIANIVKCRPPGNRNPQPDEIRECVPYLHRQITLIQPSVILAVGGVAATTLLDARGSLGSLRNRVHEYRGIPLIVTYHPAALLRNPQWKKPTWDDVRIARRIADGER